MSSLTPAQIITNLYIGYYDRAPDADGLNYWVGRYTDSKNPMTLAQIAQSFSVQTESTSEYSFLKKYSSNFVYEMNNTFDYLNKLIEYVTVKNSLGLPEEEIPANQVSIAGGFFISHQSKLDWWRTLFDEKLSLYFKHERLVKDDQIIIADCVFSNMRDFVLLRENNPSFDNWFMFQRALL
jgi:hypothetical protein